ncbi:MAG: hypothetical protein K2N87_00645 [Eubacterium sp.]|nr:hypothetical protein [Eubacterium sp.]
MIKRFKEIEGRYIEKIIGQDRLAFAHSNTNDFYDLIEWSKAGGYQGSVLMFFDFASGNVYKPFAKKRNVVYSDPVYAEGFYYFLQGDYGDQKITLYRYLPEALPEKVTELRTEDVNLYNLRIIGDPVHIVSQEGSFECYYPEKISFPIERNEFVTFIENDRIYFQAWVEEGWDEENECATDQYKYYHKVIIKDYNGNTLSEEVGSFYQAANGTWWIA